ncbi:MAG: hypothetical protein ACON46_05825 [Coraliomargaritaceae bacterium]
MIYKGSFPVMTCSSSARIWEKIKSANRYILSTAAEKLNFIPTRAQKDIHGVKTPIMENYYTYLFLTLLPIIANCSDYRTFTDKQGRQMEAKINQVSGNDVYIERRDGLTAKISSTILSEEDQAFIDQWAREQMLKDGAIEVRFSDEESKKTTVSNGGIRTTKYDAHYEVILKNTTDQPIGDIRVEYLMLKFEDKVAAKKRSAGELERKKEKVHLVTLPGRTEKRLKTDLFSMLETELEPGWVWSGGEAGRARESEDKLEGIWVKVYVGETLVLQQARPQSLIRKEVW